MYRAIPSLKCQRSRFLTNIFPGLILRCRDMFLEILVYSLENISARYTSWVVHHDRPTECRHGVLRDRIDIHMSNERPSCRLALVGRTQGYSGLGLPEHHCSG